MPRSQVLHIVDASVRARAEQARAGFEIGCHAEVYADVNELMARPPESGVVVARDDPGCGGAGRVVRRLARKGLWLPVIATGKSPRPGRVVEAIRQGALDYVSLPLRPERLAQSLDRIETQLIEQGEWRRRKTQARCRIAGLTRREREALDLLAQGMSNKMIARELGISPRTVEIHRANMMTKIGAQHAAAAVRIRLEAQLDDTIAPERSQAAHASIRPIEGHEPAAIVQRSSPSTEALELIGTKEGKGRSRFA